MQLSQSSQHSFDGRAPSFAQSPPQHGGHAMYNVHPQHRGPMMNPYQSFGEVNGHGGHIMAQQPQIYTAVYSGVSVYEMELNGVAVMKRRSDNWLNATQILKVAGVDKGKRTKVLEKEILTGEHEKVQGGYGKYQGTWISYSRGRDFCRAYGVEELLRPLLEYDADGNGQKTPGHDMATPTKEQAMAANRKRFYTTLDGRQQTQPANGTFFSNISSTASNAIAAMNKVARMNSPAPRPGSAAQRPSGSQNNSSSQHMQNSQGSFRGESQQSRPSLHSERSFQGGPHDSAYGTQGYNGDVAQLDGEEPPRKRMRPMSRQASFSHQHGADVSMREGTPTEPNESFVYHQAAQHLLSQDGEAPTALPPLPNPSDKRTEEKQMLLLNLFHDTSRTDFTDHQAVKQFSGNELDIPLDASGNTALHWAATLARVSLMRLLISRGANMFRGNAGGQTPLMAAVQVNNSLDHSCFPEMLELLAPLIEVRDHQSRTILHHIAVSCGIKGRAASSKYYLEALLEFLVRSMSANASGGASYDGGMVKPIGLMRFMSDMVNVQDKAGNTALNLAARIGNRSIIHQLLEVQADPTIPNYKGLAATDFGVELRGGPPRDESQVLAAASSQPGAVAAAGPDSPSKQAGKPVISRVEETSSQILPALTASLSTLQSQHAAEMRLKTDAIDRANAQIQSLAAQHAQLQQQLNQLQSRVKAKSERGGRLSNLRKSLADHRSRLARQGLNPDTAQTNTGTPLRSGDTERLDNLDIPATSVPSSSHEHHPNGDATVNTVIDPTHLPDLPTLRARLAAYTTNNAHLRSRSQQLKGRSRELEAMYKKVVGMCTGVPEDRIDETLPQLLQAVESENLGQKGGVNGVPGTPRGVGKTQDVEMKRVREFLNKVEGAGLATPPGPP